jgi:hypothetical protein
LAYSGVPNAGAPVRMSTFEVKPPYITGQPGLTHWANAMPASASAFCCTSAPATVIGAMAPASVNGVITIGWLCRAISITPSSIGPSYCSGEFELTTVKSDGSRSSCSAEMPRAIRAISIASRMRTAPSA